MSLKIADVETEYKKNPELKKDDVKSLMEWTEKQAHLPKITELDAILFLHACYYSNEAAKRTIENYFTIRTHSPEIFTNRDPAKLKTHYDAVLYTILPKQTKDGYKLLYSKIVDPYPEHYVMNEQVKLYDMYAGLDLIANGTNAGIVILMDMKDSTISHLARINLLVLKKFLSYVQESIPLRLKSLHIMNAMPFTDKLLALIKPFMKRELLSILHVHMNMESLLKQVPKECLPNDYGGSGGTLAELHEATKRKLLEYRDHFVADEKRVVDESKRIGKPKNADQIFGVEGTFKKLSID